MAVTAKWRQYIEAWQHSGLSQAEYCARQQINVWTFTARLCDYRKLPAADSAALIPVQIEPPATAAIVFTHVQGHRLELPAVVSARWVADLVGGSASRYAARTGRLIGHRPAELGAFAVCRIGLYLSQPGWQPLTAVAVGWQRRLVMPAPTASGQFCLAQDIGRLFRDESGTMAMVDRRGGLATIID